jgi:hypothetical protein
LTPFCLPMWNSGITHSVPTCWHLSQLDASSSRRHLILLLRQFRHAACLELMPSQIQDLFGRRYGQDTIVEWSGLDELSIVYVFRLACTSCCEDLRGLVSLVYTKEYLSCKRSMLFDGGAIVGRLYPRTTIRMLDLVYSLGLMCTSVVY